MSLCVLCGLHSVVCGLPNRTHVSLTHRAHRLELWTVNAHVLAVWRSGDRRETAIALCKTESETHGDSHRSHCCDLRVAPGVKSSLYINNRQPYTEAYRMCASGTPGKLRKPALVIFFLTSSFMYNKYKDLSMDVWSLASWNGPYNLCVVPLLTRRPRRNS